MLYINPFFEFGFRGQIIQKVFFWGGGLSKNIIKKNVFEFDETIIVKCQSCSHDK